MEETNAWDQTNPTVSKGFGDRFELAATAVPLILVNIEN